MSTLTVYLTLSLLLVPGAADWRGDWHHVTLEGVGAFEEGRCGFISFSERKLQLGPMGEGRFGGFWINTYHSRLTFANGPQCRIEGARLPAAGGRIFFWQLKARSIEGREALEVVGHSGGCQNDWCDGAWNKEMEVFETTLEWSDGRPVDRQSLRPIRFVSDATWSEKARRAEAAALAMGRLLSQGKCSEFYDGSGPWFRQGVPRAGWLEQCKELSPILSRARREIEENLYVTSVAEGFPSNGPFNLVRIELHLSEGLGTEYWLFEEKDGALEMALYTFSLPVH